MGQSSSSQQSSSSSEQQFFDAIQQLQQQNFVTPGQAKQVQKLSPAERRRLQSIITNEEKDFHQQVRDVLSQGRQSNKEFKKIDRTISPKKYFTPEEKQRYSQLDPALKYEIAQKLEQQKKQSPKYFTPQAQQLLQKKVDRLLQKAQSVNEKLEERSEKTSPEWLTPSQKNSLQSLEPSIKLAVINKLSGLHNIKSQKQGVIVKNQIQKAKHVCKEWNKEKRRSPSKPVNPESGRSLKSKKSRTYKLLNKICEDPNKVCARPDKSPFGRKKPYVENSSNKKFIKKVCSK